MSEERRLLISFSGGETSAFMTNWILKNWQYRYDKMIVVFANTGQENEETLNFVDECNIIFGFNVVWVESEVVHQKGKGTKHRVVDFNSADRLGECFEEVIKKYGIPNQNYPHCTRELKLQPITSYVRSLGWSKGSYDTAIGIRVDEIDRMSAKKDEFRLVYPLVSQIPMTKPKINSWWENQGFRLNLKGYQGNCKWCWKKTLRKHYTLIKEDCQIYDFPMLMEKKYSFAGNSSDGSARIFFREGRNTIDLMVDSLREFESFHDDSMIFDNRLDTPNGDCTDSCDAFGNDRDLESVR